MSDSNERTRTPGMPTPVGPGRTVSLDGRLLLDGLTMVHRIVHRHRRLVVAVFLLVVVIMMPQGNQTAPMYMARARLLVEDERSTGTLVQALTGRRPRRRVTRQIFEQEQFRILQSVALTTRVVERLHVDLVPEFTRQRTAPVGLLETFFSARAAVGSGLRSLPSTVANFMRPVGKAPPATNASRAATVTNDTRPVAYVGAFLGRLRIVPVEETPLIDLSFTATDPKLAARAVNAHAEEYVKYNLELRREREEQALVSLEAHLERQQQQVEESKRALVTYGEAQGVPAVDDQPNVIVAALHQLNDAVVEAMRHRLRKEAVYIQVRDLGPTSDEAAAVSAVARHPAVQNARLLLTDSQRERVSLALRYGDKHPTIVTLNARIEIAAEQLRTETERTIRSIQREYELAYDEERQLQAQLEAQKRLAADLSRQRAGTYLLETEAKSNLKIYALLVQRQKQLRVIRNSIENNVRLLSRAEVPATPLVRSSSYDWSLTVLVGLLLSVGLAFGLDYFDDTIKMADDVVRQLQTPVLSVLPAVRSDGVSLMSDTVSDDFGEAVRSLRTELTFTEGTEPTRIIAVTSAGPGEGKTTIASNLAMAFALGGAKVLLIDADMRRSSVHTRLGMTNVIGLSQVLAGQGPQPLDEGIQATHDPHLFVLTAGHPPPNPSELLASAKMKDVWASLKAGSFDWVIVDTPPVLAVTDPMLVAQYASGVVFVASDRRTCTRHATHALEMLRAGGARVIGTVLNHADYHRNKYYYSRNLGSTYTEDPHVTAAA